MATLALGIEYATSYPRDVRSSTALMLVSVVRKYADLSEYRLMKNIHNWTSATFQDKA